MQACTPRLLQASCKPHPLPTQDDGKPLREYVEARGGLDVILNRPDLVVEALKQLDPANRLVTEVVRVCAGMI